MDAIRNYVEEIWIDRFIESHVQEIKSIEDYLSNKMFDSSLLGFRFFQIEQRVIDGKIFTSEPENFTEWISNNKYVDYDEVTVGDKKIKWSNCINLQDFISILSGNTTEKTRKLNKNRKKF